MMRRHMLDADVQRRIAEFPRWRYQIDLGGHATPVTEPTFANRHAQRKAYFFRALVELCGGSLAGKRVLDLACNAGFWSLAAIEAGCEHVLGIEGRQVYVDQANFVCEAKRIDPARYAFRRASVQEAVAGDLGSFDVVLCLGLLYHVSQHMTLLERIAALNTDLLVIDTEISRRVGSLLEVRHEAPDERGSSIDHELVMVPTRQAVTDMVRQLGYASVVLRPRFTDWTGAGDYRHGWRRAFVCAKRTSLAPLAAEHEPVIDDWRHELRSAPVRALVDAVRRRFTDSFGRPFQRRRRELLGRSPHRPHPG